MEREDILEGLSNIRRAVIRLSISFFTLSALSYIFWKEIFGFIQKPLGIPLVYYSISDPFLSTVKIALLAGVFFSAPLIFRELWGSLAPFFTPHSRRYSSIVTAGASFLFYGGALICYYILLPSGIEFLVSYQSGHIKAAISIGSYVSFFASFIFAFGFAFELPLVMLLLGKAGIVNAALLSRYRRYAILVIVMASAIITPTPDLFNLSLMSLPLLVLYEISILLVRIFGKESYRKSLL